MANSEGSGLSQGSRRGDHREVKDRRPDIAEHEAIEVVHHRAESSATFDLRHRLRVDAIGDKRGTDAVAGNVADKKTEGIVPWRDQPEIAADRANRLIVRGNIDAAPAKSGGREALLDARGEQQIFFDFLVALFKLDVGFAESVFGALLLGDVGGGDDGESVSVGIFDLARRDEDGKAIAVRLRKIELVLAMPFRLPLLDAAAQYRRVSPADTNPESSGRISCRSPVYRSSS